MPLLPPEQVRSIGALSTVGLSFVLAIVLGVAGGVWLDRTFGTSPWGFLGGFVLRGAACLLRLLDAVFQRGHNVNHLLFFFHHRDNLLAFNLRLHHFIHR